MAISLTLDHNFQLISPASSPYSATLCVNGTFLVQPRSRAVAYSLDKRCLLQENPTDHYIPFRRASFLDVLVEFGGEGVF